MTAERQILATSGGFRPDGRYGYRIGPLIQMALDLSGAQSPHFCYLATATGDPPSSIAAVYAAFAGTGVDVTHLALFPMPNVEDTRSHLLAQDVIWVGGGSVANLLSVWRTHGLDTVMREAWERGVVLGGVSAGSLCWHIGGTTDSFGPDLQPVTNGLGLLPYSNGVHYDSEAQRRPLFHKLVGDGTLPAGFATDDGVGLHYAGTDLVEAVTDRDGAYGWRVEPDGRGGASEEQLATRLLV